MGKIKTFVNLFLVALLLTGCSEDLIKEWNSETTGEMKLVINAVFANSSQSRSTLSETANGLSSSWSDGDKICVYSSTGTYLGQLIRETGNTFSMTITNSNISNFAGKTLNLYYWGGFNDNEVEGPGINLTPVSSMSELQKYDFAKSTVTISSSITAGVYSGISTATFTNMLSFVKVDFLQNSAKYYEIKHITANTATGEFTVTSGSTYSYNGVKYIPVVPGVTTLSCKTSSYPVNYYDIPTFTALSGKIYGGGTSASGLLPKTFTLDPTNRHEYVEIGGKKWATCNIGASTPTDIGDFYSWGDFSGMDKYGVEVGMHDFIQENNRLYNNQTRRWAKYNGDDGKKKLEECDDSAYDAWGGKWHMPTINDFCALFADCGGNGTKSCTMNTVVNPNKNTYLSQKGIYRCTNYSSGVGGVLFYNGINRLFFPNTGHWEDDMGEMSYYESGIPQLWTSEQTDSGHDPDAFTSSGNSCTVSGWTNRQWGIPIRAVTE